MTGLDGGAPPPPGPSPHSSVDEQVREAARAIECILFASGEPVRPEQLAEAVQATLGVVAAAVELLRAEYAGRGLEVQAVARGFQLGTRPAYAEAVRRYLGAAAREPLSQAALETLAIIAYRQPITRPEIDALRGVRSDYILERLEERRLIQVVGRKPTVGRPMLYGTTDAFLRHFGLSDLQDLPPLEQFGLAVPASGQ
ncbi:MAG: SMC-Scp complex subunit ScpB [Armatimonadetes bacterium]|nr:SMC-Scp complex subunit ScpB [Armatimonadota bacterium]